MADCTTFLCYVQSIAASNNATEDSTTEEDAARVEIEPARKLGHGVPKKIDEMTPDPSTFRIIFPIIMVISVMVVIAVGFLLHRLISNAMWNNWDGPDDIESEWNEWNGRFRRRRDHIRTVSSYVDVPPTYRQVMKSTKHEVQPPTYHEVMSGTVNCGFVSEDEISVIPRDPDHFDSIDFENEAEKGNTNCLIQTRVTSTPKPEVDRGTVLLHGRRGVPSPAPTARHNNRRPKTEHRPQETRRPHEPVGPRGSTESSNTVTSSVTVVDVIASEATEHESAHAEDDDVVCSSV